MWNKTQSAPCGAEEKLAELRSKTDRDLAAILQKAMERSFEAVRDGDVPLAESEYAQTAGLLRLIRGLPAPEMGSLWRHLGELRTELDGAACLSR